MTEPPLEQTSATDTIIFWFRMELSNFYTQTGVKLKAIGATIQSRDAEETERLINEVEDLVET